MPMPTQINGKPVKTGSWTAQEDKLLGEWQAKLGNRWSSVAKRISGRTGQQCAQRWRHKVNPNIRKEKWTEEEDRRLIKLSKQYGNCWAEISRRLDGRTDQQCMGRWRRHLDPSIKRDAWQPSEDAQLQTLYRQFGSQWSAIAHGIPGRTAQQCRARFFQIESDHGTPQPRRQAQPVHEHDSEAEECMPDMMDYVAAPRRAFRQKPRKRARSPSLSPFEDEAEDHDPEEDETETYWDEQGSQPPSEFPTPLKNAYARAIEEGKDRAGQRGGGFTRSGRAVTANGSLPAAEEQPVRISARKLQGAVCAALKEGRRAVRRLNGLPQDSDASPSDHLTSNSRTPTSVEVSPSVGRRSSGRKSSGRKRTSVDPSPPFLSPMRNCHSMPSESQLLGRRHGPTGTQFDERSPQSVRHRPSGATPRHDYHTLAGPEAMESQATPVGPNRTHRGSPGGVQGPPTNGVTRWRTASPGLNILQLLQSPHHMRDGMVDSPKLGEKGMVTPEWAKQKGRDLDEAATAPPLLHPDSARGSRGPVARRLNIDQAFKGSAGGKKALPPVPRTVPQGGSRRLVVSPAKRMRINSPSRASAHCHDLDMDDGEEEIRYADSMTDLDFEELRQQERRKVRMDKENKGACDALQQLCVAAASASAAEEEEAHQAEQGVQPDSDTAAPVGKVREAAEGGHEREGDGEDVKPQLGATCAGKGREMALVGVKSEGSAEDRGDLRALHPALHPQEDDKWLAKLTGVDGRVHATLESREELKIEPVNDKLGSTSSHLRMRLHALLEDLAGVM